MEIDLGRIPKIARLVGRIEESRRMAAELPQGHAGRAELEERIGHLYVAIGRYVHWLLRQDPEAIERVRVEGLRWADQVDAELGLDPLPHYLAVPVTTADVDAEPSVAPSLERTADSRAAAFDLRELGEVAALSSGAFEALRSGAVQGIKPRSTPATIGSLPAPSEAEVELGLPEVSGSRATPEASDASDGSEPPVDALLEEPTNVEIAGEEDSDVTGPRVSGGVSVRTGRSAVGVPTDVVDPGVSAPGDGNWLASLGDALAVLGEPAPLSSDDAARAEVVHGIVAATTNFEVRWSVFPEPVQQALLGLVGARVRRLEAAVGADPDLHLAVGRMRRFSEQRGLTLVPSLRTGLPVGRDWFADERRYWNVLRAGL